MLKCLSLCNTQARAVNLYVLVHIVGPPAATHATDMENLCWRDETGRHASRDPRLTLSLQVSLFHITHNFYHYDDPPQKFLHTPLNGAPQKCFQSGPALAKAGPGSESNIWTGPMLYSPANKGKPLMKTLSIHTIVIEPPQYMPSQMNISNECYCC